MSTISSICKLDGSSELSQSLDQFVELKYFVFQFKKLPAPENTTEELSDLAIEVLNIFGMRVDEYGYMDFTRSKEAVQFQLGNRRVLIWFYSGRLFFGQVTYRAQGIHQIEGEGLQIYPNLSCYKGSFAQNRKKGRGIYVTANGDKYQGQWRNDLFQGDGVLLTQFSEYKGSFEKGLKQGYGTESFKNGDIYQGEYDRGRFHGRGKYSWKSKAFYVGQFRVGFMQGKGFWKSARDTYEGQYYRNMKHGYGIYRWKNGKVYQGRFWNGHRLDKGWGRIPIIALQKQLSYDLSDEESQNELQVSEIKIVNERGVDVKRRYRIQALDCSGQQRMRCGKYSIVKI